MIGLFDDSGNRLSITYNGLTLNASTDTATDCYEINHVLPHSTFDAVQDAKPTGDGIEIYEAFKRTKAIRLVGRVAGSTRAALFDRIGTLARTFDPSLVTFNNASVMGFLPLDFSTPTADTTNYSTGFIPGRYYMRPLSALDVVPSAYDGLACFFQIDLLAKDPRRYLQTTSSQTGAGTISNIGTYPSPATVTITLAGGAGSATYQVQNAATVKTTALVLNLSGCTGGDVVVVDMDAKTITKNGTTTMSLYVSGDYFAIEAGSNVITLTNTTHTTTVVSYRRAFSL